MEDEEFEWDDAKAAANIKKHGIAFEDAKQVFGDPLARIEDDLSEDYGEDRLLATGLVAGRLLTVIFVERGTRVRIISARQANAHERRTYHRS